MNQNQLIIRSSPFQFLKRLIVIEFIFAILPFFAGWLLNVLFSIVSDTFERLPFSTSISLNLLTVIVFTTLQVLILVITFIAWYVPVYIVNKEEIVHQRGMIFGNTIVAQNNQITDISIEQGRLAKTFNYGTLQIRTNVDSDQRKLKDIPTPYQIREQIIDFIGLGRSIQSALPRQSANQLIHHGEHQFVEFKSSFVWDYYQQRANKSLHEPVMKTIVAFLNSSGGYLLIGVADDGKILGLGPDLQALRKPNVDGFETSFNTAFNKMIGAVYRQFVDIAFPQIDQKEICLVRVSPSPEPVYLKHNGSEKFYIRAGNASQSLTISQSNKYIKQHFD